MFSVHDEFRREALSRLIYLISMQPDASSMTPDILEISDTIPNDVCILKVPRTAEKIFAGGLYEKGTVFALLELLKSHDVEPAIRKTTLMQLNVICQDPNLAKLIHDENGSCLAFHALENALKKDSAVDFLDTAIPAVGILSKIALCHPQFRRQLSEEENIYGLLVRALFTYHHDVIFQQDCALLLFLLLYCPFIMGSDRITMPKICSTLHIPIKCSFLGNVSLHWQKTSLEKIYVELSEEDAEKMSDNMTTYSISTDSNDIYREAEPCNIRNDQFIPKEIALRFLRFTFATLWYRGFVQISSKFKNKQHLREQSDCSISKNDENTISKLNDLLKYNLDLTLRETDLRYIRISAVVENINQFFQDAINATTYNNVIESVAKIQLYFFIASNSIIDTRTLLSMRLMLKRYLMTPPNNDQDILVYESVIKLFTRLIELEENEILFCILEELHSKHCIFMNLMKNYDCPMHLYKLNCKFLQVVIKKCVYATDRNEIQARLLSFGKGTEPANFFSALFEFTIHIAEECFQKRDLDRFRMLINLMLFISASRSLDFNETFILAIMKKLLNFVRTLKSFTQAGSHINKNCLLVIGNLMEGVNEFVLEDKYLKCLSGLCGHYDFEIRLLAWCILEKISRCLNGAHLLVKELSYLPGGFHACCLSTFLDNSEVPVVRASAGGLLSNLLTYTKGSSDTKLINMSVAPYCANLKSVVSNDGLRLVIQLFAKHRFYERIEESLDSFYIADVILGDHKSPITTCDIVKIYCSIFINYTVIDPGLLLKYYDHTFFEKIFQLIKIIPLCISESSLEMVGNICNLLLQFVQADSSISQGFTTKDKSYISILLELLDLNIFEKIEKTPLINILQVLRVLANENSVYRLICEILSTEKSNTFVGTLRYSIGSNDLLLQQASLQFLTSILIKGQSESFDFTTFQEILDTTVIIINEYEPIESTKKENDSLKILATKQVDLKENATYASEELFSEMHILFIRVSSNSKKTKHNCERLQQLHLCAEAIGALLKTSKYSKIAAEKLGLLDFLIDELEIIFEEMGMSCTDFIRKNGDAKKQQIIDDYLILFGILLNWYSEDFPRNEKQILQLTKIFLNTWPWINHAQKLRIVVIKLMACLTENSFSVCKQFSTSVLGYSNTVLQSVINLVVHETGKVKSSQIEIPVLELGLRIISNCCSCIEGRLQIIKLNLLDVFKNFHPSVTKSQKHWTPILVLWLQHWEIFSRYQEGGAARHLTLLCALIAKSNQEIRILALTILRNMAFIGSNRAALLSSEDFLYITKLILDEGRPEEQLLISIAIWRLIAGNCKAKHSIKSTSIPKKVKLLQHSILKSDSTDNLLNVLEILISLLNI